MCLSASAKTEELCLKQTNFWGLFTPEIKSREIDIHGADFYHLSIKFKLLNVAQGLVTWNNWCISRLSYFQHDPDQCTPGGEDGNFIMFARATSGDKRNNNKFSPCSLKAIEPVLNAKARSSKGCFTGKRWTDVSKEKRMARPLHNRSSNWIKFEGVHMFSPITTASTWPPY